MTRARTHMDETEAEAAQHLRTIRAALGDLDDGSELDDAMCALETFVAVALRVMRHSNPSKVRDAARTVEIKARLDGIPVTRGAA